MYIAKCRLFTCLHSYDNGFRQQTVHNTCHKMTIYICPPNLDAVVPKMLHILTVKILSFNPLSLESKS